MTEYGPPTYGDRLAPVYDEWTSEMDPRGAMEFLLGLVRRGARVLELGIGTGRVALPLAAAGLTVQGIDSSEEMLARLRAKPDGDRVAATLGDFADVDVEGTFDLAYVVFSTFFALPSQAEQLRCLCNVAGHLLPGGHLVLEAFVPDLGRFRQGQSVTYAGITSDGPRVDVAEHDPVEQRIETLHLVLGEGGTTSYPVHLRYVWPAELDAMAMVAGLELVARYEDFGQAPFTAGSAAHVSLYRLPQAIRELDDRMDAGAR